MVHSRDPELTKQKIYNFGSVYRQFQLKILDLAYIKDELEREHD